MGSSLPEQIQIIVGTLNHLMDVINYANFNLGRSRGFGLWTSEKCMFPFESEADCRNGADNALSNESYR